MNNLYLKENSCNVFKISEGVRWLDAGSAERILLAANKFKELESNGEYYGYIEHIALEKGFIGKRDFNNLIKGYKESDYKDKLKILSSTGG